MSTQNVAFNTRQDAVRAMGPTPYLFDKYLIRLLRNVFSDPSKFQHQELRSLMWNAKLKDSVIDIESLYNWKPDSTGRRPAVTVKRDNWTAQRLGINDEAQGGFEADGAGTFEKLWMGSHTIFAISTVPDESDLIAHEIQRYLDGFSSVIREELDMKRVTVAAIGELFEIKEYRQSYATPVTVAAAASDKWKVIMQAPLFNSTSLDMTQFL